MSGPLRDLRPGDRLWRLSHRSFYRVFAVQPPLVRVTDIHGESVTFEYGATALVRFERPFASNDEIIRDLVEVCLG